VDANAGVSPYGAALIAGIALVLGGLLTAGSNVFIEWLRRRSERHTETERDKRELRFAVRLTLAELSEISQAIRHTAKSHLTWRTDRALPAFAWREYRATLAAHLPLEAWRWVEGAYNEANALNWRVIEMSQEFKSDGPIHFIENEWLRSPFETVHHAMAALEESLGEPGGAFDYTGHATIEELEEGVWEPRDDVPLEPAE
jgi:hypothetical protein